MHAKRLLAGALVLVLSNPVVFSQAQDRGGGPGTRGSCLAPIKYRIGDLDPRFGITREDFQRAVEEAAQFWETAAGRKLFNPGARGPLTINLVYDSRQETTQRVIAARASISEKLKESDGIKDRLLPLRNKHDDLDQAYSGQLASYQRLHDDHNKIAAQSNAKGGAPEAEYQRLLGERLTLRKQADALQAKQLELNRLTDDINALVNRHNALLRRANAEANALNESGITGVAFEEGLYVRQSGEERIAVFQYDGETALRVILSHELGHALGIRHNANPSSIMSPLIHTGRLALTAEDLEGLRTACSGR